MADNSFTKGYADGSTLTEANLDTAYKSVKPALGNLDESTTGSSDKQVLRSNGSGSAPSYTSLDSLINRQGPDSLYNVGLAAAVSSNALVINLKTDGGTDPTSADPVEIGFSGSGASSVTQQFRSITAATSITVNASATLGVSGTSARRVYIYALQQAAGTVTLGVSSRSNQADSSVQGDAATAISASADDYGVLYATAANSVNRRLLGSVEAAPNSSGQWQAPTDIILHTDQDTRSEAPISGTSVGLGGFAISDSSGSFTSTSSSFVDVTNLSVSLTTRGRPVRVGLIGAGTATSMVRVTGSGQTSSLVNIRMNRNTGALVITDTIGLTFSSGTITDIRHAPNSFEWVDFPPAGTHTYKIEVSTGAAAATARITNVKLSVYEL